MKYRQYATYLITLVFAGLFSCANPSEPASSQFTVTIKGTVVRKNFTPLDSVQLILSSPFRRDSAKANGSFLISFSSSEKNAVNATMTFSRLGYFDTTRAIVFSSAANAIDLQAVSMKGLTAAQDSGGQSRPSLRAGAIVYIGSSFPNLSIYGAGGTDAVTLTFEVRDSVGNPVDTANQTLVYFRFANAPPDTFTQLGRKSVKTNSSGRATVLLGSGLRAGIASVQAYAVVKRAQDTTKVDTIRSPLVSIPIYGGFPDSTHFSLFAAKVNVPGAAQPPATSVITGLVGDTYGNPVQPGTVVYFGTTGGIVAPGSAYTTEEGKVISTLTTGNPIPAGGGIVTVTAQLSSGSSAASAAANTIADVVKIMKKLAAKQIQYSRAELAFRAKRAVATALAATRANNKKSVETSDAVLEGKNKSVSSSASGIFSRSVNVLFSGKSTITTSDTNFVIPSHGSGTINFMVADQNGNPLTGGSTIQVSVSGSGSSDVEVSGDLSKTIPDTQDKSFTKYQVTLKDKRVTGLTSNEGLSVKIDVASDNGSQSLSVTGRLLGGSSTDSGKVGSITLVGGLPDTIVVSGGGGKNSQQVQFKVLDVFSQPAKGIPINFEFTKPLNGGEYLSPITTITDASGIASVTIKSGIRSGTVQFVARVKRDSLSTVSSDPKTVYIRTGSIASIALISVSTQQLSVRSVGGTESATLVFEGRDSLGNALDFASQTTMNFKLQGDTNGVFISPNPATTDPTTGRVIASLTSGIRSGVVQVYASAMNDLVKSLPVPFTIAGGLPDAAHFTLGVPSIVETKVNFPSASSINVQVAAGDTFGNAARIGSAVYFSTNAGIIDASGSLDGKGNATVSWQLTANPKPLNGVGYVTARTVNRWGKFVQDTLRVVLSGSPIISSLDTNFTVAVGSTKQFDFTVSDALLNPLSAGATITVSSSGAGASDVALSGDISKVMPDTKDKAYTKFHIFVRDTRTTSVTKNEPLNLTINVTGPNGLAALILNGTLLGTGGGGVDSSVVGRIVLQNPTPDSVVVAGLGGIKTKDALFKVYNTFGLPAKNVLVTFKFSKSLGGGEYFSPTTALSDTGGNVKTTLTSGTSNGEVRIIATALRDSLTISSDPKVIYIIIPPNARLASQIAFLGATESDIFVAGVGSKENSTLTYEVRDSLGFPIDRQRRVFVTYTVQFFPNTFSGGGTAPVVIPSTDSTDDQGKTRTTVASGTQAGVVQIVVNIQLSGRPLLVSQPVRISVHAGFADQKHFTIAGQANFPGLDKAFQQTSITVQVADKYSNPVLQGTAVYFNSSHGTMQTGGGDAGLTDVNGFVTKTLYSANPFPVPPDTLPGMASGFSRVYARTIGKDSTRVMDSVQILWTGSPIITMTGGPASFAIPNGGSAGPYTFTVLDRLGHPMSPGTGITVTADACTVNGDANISMPDTQVGGPGLTSFTVLLIDSNPPPAPATVPPTPSVLTVTVTHPVYGTYKLVLASGTVQ
jgi:hypothetical protein